MRAGNPGGPSCAKMPAAERGLGMLGKHPESTVHTPHGVLKPDSESLPLAGPSTPGGQRFMAGSLLCPQSRTSEANSSPVPSPPLQAEKNVHLLCTPQAPYMDSQIPLCHESSLAPEGRKGPRRPVHHCPPRTKARSERIGTQSHHLLRVALLCTCCHTCSLGGGHCCSHFVDEETEAGAVSRLSGSCC